MHRLARVALLVPLCLGLILGYQALVVFTPEEVAPPALAPPATAAEVPPNFVVIVSDDQRYDTMWAMPRTQYLLFDQGITFQRAYVTTPLCCPSRASVLTGNYAHNHGTILNPYPLERRTFVEDLHDAGYRTALVGKYLNSWDGSPRAGYDRWVSISGGLVDYNDPLLNVDGRWQRYPGYTTDVLRDHALAFIDEAAAREGPFLLLFTPTAPHWPADPAPGDEELYLDLAPNRPPSFQEEDVSDKPRWLRERPPLTAAEVSASDALRLKHLQSLTALDKAVHEIVARLDERGELENTVIFYTSDNGVFFGEHRLTEKVHVYEEAIHVPFAIRYSAGIPAPTVESALVANIDMAPTIYELAGLVDPPATDGRSLVPLFTGAAAWRDALLVEAWQNRQPYYSAVHTGTHVYVRYAADTPELYDLRTDPYQLQNLAGDPRYAATEGALGARLDELLRRPES